MITKQLSNERFNSTIFVLLAARFTIMLVPFLTIPSLITIFGLNDWGRIVIAQTIGTIIGVGVDLSWTTFGASRIKKLHDSDSKPLVAQARKQRFIALLIFELIGIIFIIFLIDDDRKLLFFLAANFAIATNYSNSWYWIAQGKTTYYFLVEAAPKLLITVFFLPFLHTYESVTVYFVIFTLINLCINFCFPKGKYKSGLNENNYSLRSEIKYGATRMFQTVYYLSSLPLLGLYHPQMIGQYAIIERSYRLVMSISLPFAQDYQSVLMKSKLVFREALKRATKLSFFACTALFVTITPIYNEIVFKTSNKYPLITLIFLPLIILVTFNRIIGVYATFAEIEVKLFSRLQILAGCCFIIICIPLVKYANILGSVYAMILTEFVIFGFLIKYISEGNNTKKP
jgi:hypothetical protein